MNKENMFMADPYNEKHIELFKKFEYIQGSNKQITSKLERISDTLSKDEYIKQKRECNEVDEILFINGENCIEDFCQITGEKDMKTCYLYFPKIKNDKKNRSIIQKATEYSLNSLGMETVFVMTEENDKKTAEALERLSYESLGSENGIVTYMAEKQTRKEKGRSM